MKLNLVKFRESLRQLGIGLIAVGLLVGILKESDILTVGGLALAGLVLVLVGSLERS